MKKLLKSRTVWTIVVMVILNGFPSVRELIPGGWLPYVDSVLGLLAIYFKVNPSQNYGEPV